MGIFEEVKAMLAVLFAAANGCQVLGAVQRHGKVPPKSPISRAGSSIADLTASIYSLRCHCRRLHSDNLSGGI